MKIKKYSYILVITLILFVGMKGVYAKNLCEPIFGSAHDPNSLRYLLNEILQIPKYIVPIIVIGLGMLDFSKAVIASKPDEMKKAQTTFIKRVLIGVCIFFIPTILNVIMYFVDIILGSTGQCSI